ncbi:MAG: hypothetical protein U9R57_06305 [Thermodesulfobacteriota bacterium]|nr:hypothetical protein [Thermodesulfobacteriota bacterium]
MELAIQSDAADDMVDRLIATPQENTARFKEKLSSLKHSRHFIDWRESLSFSRELEAMLQDLEAGVSDPMTGVELVSAFYETDKRVFDNCNDSSDHVGQVYSFDAKELFVKYASRCENKEKVADIILKLQENDDYGVREILIDSAADCLPETVIRSMITKIQKLVDTSKDEYQKRYKAGLIESLARQIKDAKLFAETRISSWEKLTTAAQIGIARVYLESGDANTAHSWLKKISADDTSHGYEQDELLLNIYRQLGEDQKLTELLYKKLKSYRSTDTLQELLDVIGEEKRGDVILAETAEILSDKQFRSHDAEFLISIGKIDAAETYLLDRASKINGDLYSSLLPLAQTMETEERSIAASVIYRSLLTSILDRGYTKAYSYGAQYLKQLDTMADSISDWGDFEIHDVFKNRIYEAHKRKRSFWPKYDGKS